MATAPKARTRIFSSLAAVALSLPLCFAPAGSHAGSSQVDSMAHKIPGSHFPEKRDYRPHELSSSALEHQKLLFVSRDFGPDPEDIAIDAWVRKSADPKIEEVRMWFVRHDDGRRRSPFSAKVLRSVTVGYEKVTDKHWRLGFAGDDKEFMFQVELDSEGRSQVFADVRVSGGQTIEHCRVTKAHMPARKLLGITVGIKGLRLSCIDDEGQSHRGRMKYRKV